jgi:TonB-dependent receptor
MAMQVIQMEGLVIESDAPEETQQDQLLEERRQAVEIQDAIGSDEMSRTGSGDAAEAVSKVTGTSVVDGKYVYVRGLGDRYSSTQLNGSELPSADPYRKAVHMDMFPSSLLDKIVTIKTFSPDKPGNFSGGAVEMWTKRFPESFTFSFSQSASYNERSTFNNDAILYPGGSEDWLGMDDGTRALPDLVRNGGEIPSIGTAWGDRDAALQLDRISKAFNPVMAPSTQSLPMNQSYSVSLGNQFQLFDRPLGILGSFSYSRKSSFYDDGSVGRWQLTGQVSQVDELNNDYQLNDTRGSAEALWGGLMNISYKVSPDHEVGFNYIHNQSGESEARYLYGTFPRDLSGNSIYETRVLKYTERSLNSFQLRGEHDITDLHDMHIEWTGAVSQTGQEEPDLRYFTDNYTIRERNGSVDTTYAIRNSIYPLPNRYYRDLQEDNFNLTLDVGVPFKQWNGLYSKFKFGGALNGTNRAFRENRYEFHTDDRRYNYTGDPYGFWNSENVGLVDTSGTLNRFGNYIVDASEDRGNYDGESTVAAGFAMVELPLTPKYQFIGGLRVETTDITVSSFDEEQPIGEIRETDFLPAANLIYLMSDAMNLRVAYGRTLARPNFREMAPYSSFDFVNDLIFTGNENLKRTLIDNYDIRWEWFVRTGEVLAASVFYKNFTNPIERVIKTINGEVQYQNVDNAKVVGLELEIRQRLDRIHPVLDPFQIGANFSLVHSEVSIAPEELSKIRAFDPDAPAEREMQGQSPYVLNLDFSYVNEYYGTSATVLFNIFGERLSEVSLGGTPDVMEQPRGMLDFNFKQRIWNNISLKFAAKNILDAETRKIYPYKGQEFVSRAYRYGRSFSLGIGYSFSQD